MKKGSCCDGCGCGGGGLGGRREMGGNDGHGLGGFDCRNLIHSNVYYLMKTSIYTTSIMIELAPERLLFGMTSRVSLQVLNLVFFFLGR